MEGAFLVFAHEARVPGDIGRQYRRNFRSTRSPVIWLAGPTSNLQSEHDGTQPDASAGYRADRHSDEWLLRGQAV